MGELIQFISIFIEVIITVLGILLALQKKKVYGFGIALTFGIYTFYDFVGLYGMNINPNVLYWIFFLATASALWTVLTLYKQGGKKK